MENLNDSQKKFLLVLLLGITSVCIIFLSLDGFNPTEIGMIPIFIAMSIRLLSTIYEIPRVDEIQTILVCFTISHNLLFSFFTEFSLMLILGIFIGILVLVLIRPSGDSLAISSLIGILLGIQSMKLSLIDGGWSLPLPVESLDILYLNWTKFLSAPIIGAIFFISIRILVTSIPKSLDESE